MFRLGAELDPRPSYDSGGVEWFGSVGTCLSFRSLKTRPLPNPGSVQQIADI